MPLLSSRRFLPLLVTQTLGAVNDNLFKNALVVMILFRTASTASPVLVALSGGVFILPYILFSATAGQVADRFDKARCIQVAKIAEVLLMAAAAAGFLLGSTALCFCVLFGLGVQATFFGPLKYAILPDHLPEHELVAGNGLIEAGTFGGILAGTVAGAALFALPDGPAVVSALGVAVAFAGVVSAWFVRPAPSKAPGLRVGVNIARETALVLRAARRNRPVWLSLLGLSWFWVLGSVLLSELPTIVRDGFGGSSGVFTALLLVFSLGVGAGSAGCGRLLRGEVSARLTPFAALGLSAFLWDFGRTASAAGALPDVAALLHAAPGWRMGLDLLGLGACGGLYSVPLYAILQDSAAPGATARAVAANNIVNAVAMVGGAAAAAALATAGVWPTTVLVAAAAVNVLVALWIVRLIPQETMRGVFRWYFTTFHGVRVAGLENLPKPGQPAVIVVNHQSFADGCFVAAFLPGAPVFAVNVHVARTWWARPFLAAVRSFPVDPANPFSAKAMVRAVQDGQTLVVFPEGRITVTGALMKVYEGAGMVADRAGAVLAPVRIDGLQYTRLSRMAGRVPRRWFPPLSLTVMPPVTPHPDPALSGRHRRQAVGAILQGVMEDTGFATAETGRSLWQALGDAQNRYGARLPILEDIARAPVAYGKVRLGACVLGRRLRREAPAGGRIGVLLPNSNAAVVTFMALQAWNRVPALLNFSAGAGAMLAACRAAQVGTVLSSRLFVDKAKLSAAVAGMEHEVRFVWLEDVRASLGPWVKLRGWLDTRRRLPGSVAAADSPAVVLFTSGSEGAPKGVVLSHRNILANIAQLASVVDFSPADRVFNAMPMFHSFGLTGGTLLPLLSGVRTFHYPSPLHYRIVPALIYDTDSTVAFGTDTFLTGWARFAHPYDFYAMRYVFSGAEKVREETRRLYAERFGVRVMEGYGATETAPVLALNTPMHSRVGTAGRLLPGIEHRIEPVQGIAEGGRLVVRGPNVMLGYLRETAPGVLEPLIDGWYDTGDVCTVDADGFVTIVARAKRFAKVAGEMVSMPAAEALAARLWPDAAHAVVAVSDSRKGEALVLLTTRPGATLGALLAHARAFGAAEIGVPRTVQVVDALPLLGSGKVDYAAAARMVEASRREAA